MLIPSFLSSLGRLCQGSWHSVTSYFQDCRPLNRHLRKYRGLSAGPTKRKETMLESLYRKWDCVAQPFESSTRLCLCDRPFQRYRQLFKREGCIERQVSAWEVGQLIRVKLSNRDITFWRRFFLQIACWIRTLTTSFSLFNVFQYRFKGKTFLVFVLYEVMGVFYYESTSQRLQQCYSRCTYYF